MASTALRMAIELGYNEISDHQLNSTAVYKEMAYVFWVAVVLDTKLSLTAQTPSNIRVGDINTPLPGEHVLDWWQSDGDQSSPDCKWSLSLFAQQCTLAIIEAKASEQLFSTAARRRSTAENTQIYNNITARLREWRQKNPLSWLSSNDVMANVYVKPIGVRVIECLRHLLTLLPINLVTSLISYIA
jgi:hypothetical protein